MIPTSALLHLATCTAWRFQEGAKDLENYPSRTHHSQESLELIAVHSRELAFQRILCASLPAV